MSLLRKFALLLGMLGLTVAVNLAIGLWALFELERELSAPLRSIADVEGGLNGIKRDLGAVAAMLPIAPAGDVSPRPWMPVDHGEADAGGAPLERFQRLVARIGTRLDRLETSDSYKIRSGISTTRNLRDRISDAIDLAGRFFGDGDLPAGAEARGRIFDLHELIERTEAKMSVDSELSVANAHQIRSQMTLVMAGALGLAVLTGVLGIALTRRWVVRPVANLRTAADRIARGDFSYRLPAGAGHDELALLSGEVNHMASMISTMQEERVERERLAAIGEMVRRLAHNLRNPLAGIRSLAELTRSELAPDSPLLENQARIISTVDRFEAWLRDLLSATTPLSIAPKRTQIGAWLAGIIEPLRPMAAAKGVVLALEADPDPIMANFDERHLEQALVAVLTNAIQATPRGSTVSVGSRICESGRSWELRVADSGQGVPNDLQEKVFRPYFTTKRDGTGIGLAVAKQVVEQHGGRIWVETGPDRPANGTGSGPGAVFVLRMPVGGDSGLAIPGQVGARIGQDPDH